MVRARCTRYAFKILQEAQPYTSSPLPFPPPASPCVYLFHAQAPARPSAARLSSLLATTGKRPRCVRFLAYLPAHQTVCAQRGAAIGEVEPKKKTPTFAFRRQLGRHLLTLFYTPPHRSIQRIRVYRLCAPPGLSLCPPRRLSTPRRRCLTTLT